MLIATVATKYIIMSVVGVVLLVMGLLLRYSEAKPEKNKEV